MTLWSEVDCVKKRLKRGAHKRWRPTVLEKQFVLLQLFTDCTAHRFIRFMNIAESAFSHSAMSLMQAAPDLQIAAEPRVFASGLVEADGSKIPARGKGRRRFVAENNRILIE
jgi:hypothetical protein